MKDGKKNDYEFTPFKLRNEEVPRIVNRFNSTLRSLAKKKEGQESTRMEN